MSTVTRIAGAVLLAALAACTTQPGGGTAHHHSRAAVVTSCRDQFTAWRGSGGSAGMNALAAALSTWNATQQGG